MLLRFFFNDTATTEIYTLSLHDALPISTCTAARTGPVTGPCATRATSLRSRTRSTGTAGTGRSRSEEHTSELQSQSNLVCRLLLEKIMRAANNTMLEEWSSPLSWSENTT